MMNTPRFSTRSSGSLGFTLVEILIGIAVLAALIVMLSSGLQIARQRSADVKCLHNLRSTGFAAIRCFSDRGGELFPSKFWYSRLSTAERWGMRDYLGITSGARSSSPEFLVDSLLTCPRAKMEYPVKFPNMLNRCFTMNRFLVGKDPNAADELTAGPNPGSPRRLSNIPSPSRMWAFMDGASGSPNDASEFATIASVSSPFLYPHQNRQNIVFMDGHVESWTREMVTAPPSLREFWGDLNRP